MRTADDSLTNQMGLTSDKYLPLNASVGSLPLQLSFSPMAPSRFRLMSHFQHAGDWIPALHGKVQAALEPMVRANYKDRYGAAVGYLTADLTSMKLSKA